MMRIEEDKSKKNLEEDQLMSRTKKKNRNEIYLFLLLTFVLISGLTTLSFAFYRQYFDPNSSINSNNTIKTGDIIFAYSDNSSEPSKPSNAIRIVNAIPISDNEGKNQFISDSYFDFQILATSAGNNLKYQVLLEKLDGSTIADNNLKVYVTELHGQTEVAVTETLANNIVKTYNQYSDRTVDGVKEKILFERNVNAPNYQMKYRLRFWISNLATDYQNKKFSAKVNISVTAK